MGKSPGKWIKTVLFGKKSSKSNLSKGVPIEKKATSEQTTGDLGLNHSVISDTRNQSIDRGGEKAESERSVPGDVCDPATSMPAMQDVALLETTVLSPADKEERARQEEAATKAQAAFRGYLARRAFRALKGIIRLQALIRGHLVRRQAIATLHCMQSVVRLQALARGQKVGSSSVSGKLAKNAFVRKLLMSLPTAMPLSLQYDLTEPNSAWVWLERWSMLHFWEPIAQPKNIIDVKFQGKQASGQIPEAETGKSRRTFRKVTATATSDNNGFNSLDMEKPRRNTRKSVSPQMESQDQATSELERVKRNLRKVSAATATCSEKSETETEKPLQNVRKPSNVTSSDVSEPAIVDVPEKPSDSGLEVDKSDEMEILSKPLAVDEHTDMPDVDHPAIEEHFVENGTNVDISATVQEEESIKEDQTGKENQRSRRRKSFPVKQEFAENVLQNTPSLPSYMAATESAKAKLRLQAAAKFSEEGVDNGFVRRHSLPSSTNGKLSSLSPRVQKPAQANGKGGSKINKSLSSSKDERVLQPGWRR